MVNGSDTHRTQMTLKGQIGEELNKVDGKVGRDVAVHIGSGSIGVGP